MRSVIVFGLRPMGDVSPKPGQTKLDAVLNGSVTTEVAVEEQWTERAFVNPGREPYEAERREQASDAAAATKVSAKKIVPRARLKAVMSCSGATASERRCWSRTPARSTHTASARAIS